MRHNVNNIINENTQTNNIGILNYITASINNDDTLPTNVLFCWSVFYENFEGLIIVICTSLDSPTQPLNSRRFCVARGKVLEWKHSPTDHRWNRSRLFPLSSAVAVVFYRRRDVTLFNCHHCCCFIVNIIDVLIGPHVRRVNLAFWVHMYTPLCDVCYFVLTATVSSWSQCSRLHVRDLRLPLILRLIIYRLKYYSRQHLYSEYNYLCSGNDGVPFK